MRDGVSAIGVLACLVLSLLIGAIVLAPQSTMAGDARVASAQDHAPPSAPKGSFVGTPRQELQDMSTPAKTAQMRCPGGTLLFLSNSCGCNGACCACSLQARYLNNCTCQCQQAPPPQGACRLGFSVGSQ